MRLLVDAQLPPALARWLGEHGLSATAVRQLGLRDSDDGSIWNFATSGGWTVVTKDEDFVAAASANPPLLLSCGCASATAPTAFCSRGSNRCCPTSRNA
jgi:predicted nuclease of predicted toxin-antitoxin system